MKRSLKLAAAAVATAATVGLAAPAANAASFDQHLYPQTGQIFIDPVTVQVLNATPAGDIARVGAQQVNSTVGPSTTVLVLHAVEGLINRDVAYAASKPGTSVEYHWEIDDGSVRTFTRVGY